MSIGVVISILLLMIMVVITFGSGFQKRDFSFLVKENFLLSSYFFLIVFITLPMSAFGLSKVFSSATSYLIDIPFAYTVYTMRDMPAKPVPVTSPETGETQAVVDQGEFTCGGDEKLYSYDGNKYCFNPFRQKKDIVDGFTLFISMGILFILHYFGIMKYSRSSSYYSTLKKAYLFSSLTLMSIIGLIAVPVAIYSTITYFVFDKGQFNYYGGAAPGEALAVAICIVPLWMLFLAKVLKNRS